MIAHCRIFTKNTHNGDVYLDGNLAVQYRREHGNTLFGEYERGSKFKEKREVKVLAPEGLKKEIRRKLEQALGQYKFFLLKKCG